MNIVSKCVSVCLLKVVPKTVVQRYLKVNGTLRVKGLGGEDMYTNTRTLYNIDSARPKVPAM